MAAAAADVAAKLQSLQSATKDSETAEDKLDAAKLKVATDKEVIKQLKQQEGNGAAGQSASGSTAAAAATKAADAEEERAAKAAKASAARVGASAEKLSDAEGNQAAADAAAKQAEQTVEELEGRVVAESQKQEEALHMVSSSCVCTGLYSLVAGGYRNTEPWAT